MTSVFALTFSPTIERVIAEVKDFVRCRDPELRNKLLRSDRKTSAQHICNIAEEQLNSKLLNIKVNISAQQYVVCFRTSILLQSLLYTLYSLDTVLLPYLSY